jgi:hypothetical protein
MFKGLLAVLVVAQVNHAQSSPSVSRQEAVGKNGGVPVATVALAKSKISVDGILNEPDWAEAPPIGEIIQREPKQGEKASEQTVVKLLYDSQNIYVGVTCYDSEPQKVIGTQMARDADLSVDDRVEILIDSFHDRRNAFYFSTNPLGALVDALIIENGETNRDWNAIWDVRSIRMIKGGAPNSSYRLRASALTKASRPGGSTSRAPSNGK